MSVRLDALLVDFEKLWPLEYAEAWDSVGLVSGNHAQTIKRVLLSVDVTASVLQEAEGFDLVLSHHPLLLKGVTSIAEQTSKGAVLAAAIRQGTALYAAHTNADSVIGGVSDSLAVSLGLINTEPLVPSQWSGVGSGRIGELPQQITLLELAKRLAIVLPPTASGIRVSGDHETLVKTIALCGGAGDAFIGQALKSAADVYITSDLRHHVVQEALESASAENRIISFIDVSHWAAEWVWLHNAANQLRVLHPSIEFVVCELRTDPWDFVVTQ